MSEAATSFEAHVASTARRALLEVPHEAASDVYAVSFLIYDADDDPRMPTLTVGYNTEARVREATQRASDEAEARWNYAYWHKDEQAIELAVICDEERDPDGAQARERWIEERGLSYSDEDEDRDFDAAMELGEQITVAFVELAVSAARQLHTDGVIEQTFGRSIPILVHELEYYDEIAEQTRRANPPGVSADFERWVTEGQ